MVVVKITEETDELVKFTLSGTCTAMANALRRIMISEVPTYAIEQVVISKNTTIIPDEMIAHRLGLIPLTSPSEDIGHVEFKLSATCSEPGINIITSDQLESSDDRVIQAVEEITVVKGISGQVLELTATACMGIGRDHAKWSPVCRCFYVEKNAAFDFIVESVGSLTPKEIVSRAIKVLIDKLTVCAT